ncbi:MAG: glycoside hydrolase family 3 N-terminal domain-containing protein [Ardenticatenaceae bacterium]
MRNPPRLTLKSWPLMALCLTLLLAGVLISCSPSSQESQTPGTQQLFAFLWPTLPFPLATPPPLPTPTVGLATPTAVISERTETLKVPRVDVTALPPTPAVKNCGSQIHPEGKGTRCGMKNSPKGRPIEPPIYSETGNPRLRFLPRSEILPTVVRTETTETTEITGTIIVPPVDMTALPPTATIIVPDMPNSTQVPPTPTRMPTSPPTATIMVPDMPNNTPLPPTMMPTNPPTSVPTAPPEPLAVEPLIAQMTLEEKVGQLFLVYFVGPNLSPALMEMINQYHVGGILLFSAVGNVKSMPQVAQLINDAQQEAVTHGAGVPLLVALDQEGGPVVRLTEGATVFPSNMAVGATGKLENARLMAQVSAQELKALGINMNLAPVLDVNNNPDNPVIGIRSFGSDPWQVAQFGTAMIESYRANGIIATAKHFPGHGDTSVDSHFGLPIVRHEASHLKNIELVPFQAAIDANVDAIMTAHILFPAFEPTSQLPATLSPNVLIGLLRKQMGFQGLIVTDSLGMGALSQRYTLAQAAGLAFQAGADILAFGPDGKDIRPAYRHVLSLVQSGVIPQSHLDQSVRRVLEAKARYGLLNWEPVNINEIPQRVGTQENLAIARQIAQESITLVKNDAQIVPISPEESVLLIWPPAIGDFAQTIAPYHANLRQLKVGLNPTQSEIDQATQEANHASVVIYITKNAARYRGQTRLANALSHHRLIVAAVGSPYDLMRFPNVPTYLATYGHVSPSRDALAQTLFGITPPKGRLPVELP